MSISQKWVLGGMVAAGALLGVLSPGAATGHAVIDAVYRAILVVVVGMAASRARRWALIVSAALASVASIGLGLVFGIVALLMAGLLVGRDLRNRIYSMCVGIFVAMACLRLEIGLFVGASALVAAMSIGLLLWSGYRVSRSRTRKICRRAALVAAAMAAVGVGLAIYEGATVGAPLKAAVDSAVDGISLAQAGDTEGATAKFDSASQKFSDVAESSSAWWLFPTRLVPVVSQNVAVVPVMSEAGASLSDAAGRMTSEVDYGRLRRDGGGVELGLLAQFREPVLDVSDRLDAASDRVDGIRSPWILGPLATRIDQFDDKVTDLQEQTALAVLALEHGPAIFGGSGERRYLLLLGNPAELRDLGGHIGNVAELSIVDGKMSLVKVERPLALSRPELEDELQESGDLPLSVLALNPAKFPQNWGASIDFPTDARIAARLYESVVGRKMDGVMYADPFTLAGMLSITGPIPIPGLDQQLNSENAVKFLTLDQFTAYPSQSAADEVLTTLLKSIFEKLVATTLPGPSDLGAKFGPLVQQGRFRMVSLHPEDHPLLARLGLDTGFAPVPGDDLLAVVTRNANPSKIDSFLRRSTAYAVRWDPASGGIRGTVTVTLENTAPATGLPPYVIGNSAKLPSGTNISDLAVVTPFEATRATVDGIDADLSPVRDGDVWRHTVRVEIPPGKSVKVVIGLEGEVAEGSTYRLHFSGQPMVNDGSMQVSVDAEDGTIVSGPGIEATGGSATATLRESGQTILTLRDDR